MAHVAVVENLPGIVGLLEKYQHTARPLSELAEVLLRSEGGMTRGERELIAAFVSGLNQCTFCCSSHSAAAAAQLEGGEGTVEAVRRDFMSAAISDKMKALLRIAEKVQGDSRLVNEADVQAARNSGASDLEIHDTVLIAAAFCMFNRYVDGLGTWAPQDAGAYREMGRMLARDGYLRQR